MAGFGKLALTALAVSLLPYEVKKDEDGGISYKSLLVNVKAKKGQEGERKVELSFFQKPDFVKDAAPDGEAAPAQEAEAEAEAEPDVVITVDVSTTLDVTAQETDEEAPAEEDFVQEAPAEPVEETPAPAEEPVNE